jgi:hypothetical protein
MFEVIVIFIDGHEEKQGKYKTKEYAEARALGLKKHYSAIKECKIIATGKDKEVKV